jgi:hypothetical protein
MKYLLSLTLLLMACTAQAKTKKPIPIKLELMGQNHSNIDKVSNPVKKNIYSQKIQTKTKIKFKPMRKVILIDLPSIDLEYTPSLTEKVRSLSISNTLIGLYLPKRGLIYSGSFNTSYTKSIFTNEDQQVEDSKNYSVAIDGGAAKDIFKKYNLGLNLGVKLQNFLEPSNPNDALPLKDNNLRLTGKVTQRFKINKMNTLGFNLNYTDKIYKEKRALNSTGDQISTQVETIHTYDAEAYYSFRHGKLRITPELGFTLNKDTVADGRTYRGLFYQVDIRHSFQYFKISSRYSYKVRDYRTQLVDTVDTTGASPLLEARIVSFYNQIEIPFGKKSQYQILAGFDYQGLKSNRKSDDNANEIIKLGLRLTF